MTGARSVPPSRNATVRVLVADDHPLWRAGVRALLDAEPDLEVVAEAADGAEVLRLLRSVDVDVLLLDMEMPGVSGVDVARSLARDGLAVRVLALSAYDSAEYVGGLFRAGAAGYLTKDKAPALVAEAVRAVAHGEGRWFVTPPSAGLDNALILLSDREREVLTLLAGGASNKEIAEALFIAENTVRNHLTAVYAKTGASSSRAAMVWAWRNGIGAG